MRTRTIALILVAIFLSGCGPLKVVKPPEPAPSGPMKTMKFESGNEGDAPAGWKIGTAYGAPDARVIEGEAPKFKMEYTEDEKRSGKMSAVLRPIGKDKLPVDNITTASFCGDSPFHGAAMRVSAYIKADPGGAVLFGANLSGEPAGRGSVLQKRGGGWTKFEVMNLLPPPPPTPAVGGATRHLMCVNLGVSGSNRAWIDDVTFTKLDLAGVPQEKIQAVQLENLDMEKFDRAGTLSGWFLNSAVRPDEVPEGFQLSADRKVKRSGAASLHLTTDEPLDMPPGDVATQCTDAAPLLGKTLRVAGWMKSDLGEGRFSAGLIAVAFAVAPEEISTLTMLERLTRGDLVSANVNVYEPTDWTQHQVMFSVPKTAKSVCMSIQLDQIGSVWADDLTVEVIEL